MVRDLPAAARDPAVTLSPRPDDEWLACYRRDVSVDVLTAVVGGEVVFAYRAGAAAGRAAARHAAVGRAAVTTAPDGTRWVGLSAMRVAERQRGLGHGGAL
jgi:hypothetical protein